MQIREGAQPIVGDLPEQDREHDLPKRVNGGLNAWLTVLAGFCIFVNSWLVPFHPGERDTIS